MTPTTRKTSATKSSASVDVQQKPVGTIKRRLTAHDIKAAARAADDQAWEAKRDAERKSVQQPLDGRDALKALQSTKTKTLAAAKTAIDKLPAKSKVETKAVSAKSKKTRNGVPASKTPEARIARRNYRNMLKALTIAADESQDAEVREYAEQRAEALAAKLNLK